MDGPGKFADVSIPQGKTRASSVARSLSEAQLPSVQMVRVWNVTPNAVSPFPCSGKQTAEEFYPTSTSIIIITSFMQAGANNGASSSWRSCRQTMLRDLRM